MNFKRNRININGNAFLYTGHLRYHLEIQEDYRSSCPVADSF